MIRLIPAYLLLGLLLSPAVPATTVYTWTDNQGNQHYSDERPPGGVSFRTLEMPASAPRSGAAPSQRVRDIRCRDFEGALDQLLALDDVGDNADDWLAAKTIARDGINQWCRSP